MKQEGTNIAVVSSNPENGFFAQILWAMQEESLETSYDLEIYFMMSAVKKGGADYLYEKICREKKTGAVITIAHQIDMKFIQAFKKAGITTVLVDAHMSGIHSVGSNNEKGAYDAVDFLIKSGRKRIGIVIGDYVAGEVQRERLNGVKNAFNNAHMNFDESLIWNINDYDYQAGKEALRFMLASDVDAVFCAAGDYVAHGFLNEARKQHLDVPGGIALIGYDDIEMSADSGLTTVRQPLYEMGKEAFRTAVRAIENPGLAPQIKIFDNDLIIRETA